jgi:hypothetical protein
MRLSGNTCPPAKRRMGKVFEKKEEARRKVYGEGDIKYLRKA